MKVAFIIIFRATRVHACTAPCPDTPVPVTPSLYEVYEPEFTRRKFGYAAMNAAALNGTGTVMPYVALGAGSRPSLAIGTLQERSLGAPERF